MEEEYKMVDRALLKSGKERIEEVKENIRERILEVRGFGGLDDTAKEMAKSIENLDDAIENLNNAINAIE